MPISLKVSKAAGIAPRSNAQKVALMLLQQSQTNNRRFRRSRPYLAFLSPALASTTDWPCCPMTPTSGVAAGSCRVCQKAGARTGKLPTKYCDATSCVQ
eukprot:scaffold58054_cov75-Phaeocystis_antarctica.AAC.3